MGAARIRPCPCRLRRPTREYGMSECEFQAWTAWAARAKNLHESEAKQSACHLASTTILDRLLASSAEPHSVRRTLCPPGYLCRIARTQASDHLGHPTKFRETGEEIAANCPQPRHSPCNTLPVRRGASYSRDPVAMKATVGARKVNMADENSHGAGLLLQAISSRAPAGSRDAPGISATISAPREFSRDPIECTARYSSPTRR